MESSMESNFRGLPALLRMISSRRPVILIYHGVPSNPDQNPVNKESFERQIAFLKNHFQLIHPDALSQKRSPFDRIQILLTFDDTFLNNANVVAPILRKYEAPGLFFACTRHATAGKLLWFAYLWGLERFFPEDGLQFQGRNLDMRKENRASTMSELREYLLNLTPHPQKMYEVIENELPCLHEFVDQTAMQDMYSGMTEKEIREIAADPLFSLGVHTVDHPVLIKCDIKEMRHQISENKRWLESFCNEECTTISYPQGFYDERVIEIVKDIGIRQGFVGTPTLNRYPDLEMPRVGIYSPSLNKLLVKVQWGNWMRTLKLKIG